MMLSEHGNHSLMRNQVHHSMSDTAQGRIKEVRQITIMRLKWPDLSILMTENAGLFVEGTMLLSMITMEPLSKT